MTLIDNIFIDNNRTYTIHPLPNGLSDHDGQNSTILNLPIPSKHMKCIHTTKFDNDSITHFQLQLSYEQWDNVFGNSNINEIFNNFLNTHLRCYNSSFKQSTKNITDNNQWTTIGIKTSSKRIRELFLQTRLNNDTNLKTYYKRYCKALSNIILAAKNLHYNRIILNSKNKMASTWEIIKKEKGKYNAHNTISLKVGNKEVTNQNKIATIFNNYFLSIAEALKSEINKHTNSKGPNPIRYL